jgi:oligopeptide/dipeptide ABC transporter ATP-binding protein
MALTPIEGSPPDLSSDIVGCPFRPRCPYSVEESGREDPHLELVEPNHWAACWNPQGRREVTA